MTTVAVRHHVTDFDTWLVTYKEHGAGRDRIGCTGDAVMRDADDPNDVLVLTYWPSLEQAQQFASDPSLPEVMAKAGVVGPPRIEFYEAASA
jgi:heme-degrading monooxygenase HmoA